MVNTFPLLLLLLLLFCILLALILQPQYEKVARLFNGANAVHPGIILMTRVDCANKVKYYFTFCIDPYVNDIDYILWFGK